MLHYLALIIRIQCIGGFIKKQVIRILIHRTGYQNTLSLPLADAISFHTDFSIVSQR